MKTIELETFNSTKNATSTVMVDHIVAMEPHFDRPEQCRLHLTGGKAVLPMRSPASFLELIGDYSPFIMLEIFDPVKRGMQWAVFVGHITAITRNDGKQDESQVTLSDGNELRALVAYEDLLKLVNV